MVELNIFNVYSKNYCLKNIFKALKVLPEKYIKHKNQVVFIKKKYKVILMNIYLQSYFPIPTF